MGHSLIFDGRPHSPYSIFVRQPHPYSDADLLGMFGLGDYVGSTSTTRDHRHAVIADASGWTMLSDDWHYTLWHAKATTRAIDSISANHDLFACTEGDCDRSFDYQYFRNGTLKRHYVVESPGYADRKVVLDLGRMIEGEADVLHRDGYNIGLDVASLLGIQTRFTEDDLRVYVPSTIDAT